MELSCPPGTTRCDPQEKCFPESHILLKSLIDQACSVKMAGHWPRFFSRVYGPQLLPGP